MAVEHKDFFGVPLEIGDRVFYAVHNRTTVERVEGRVVAMTDKRVRIEYLGYQIKGRPPIYEKKFVAPETVVIVFDPPPERATCGDRLSVKPPVERPTSLGIQ